MDFSRLPDEGFTSRYANATPLPVRPRGMLEIIVDTCSNSPDQLAMINRIVDRVVQARPRIYQDYRIVMPVQIATETNRMIFPEFLSAELARAPLRANGQPSNLRQFYRQHAGHVCVVETDISRAYKFFYAKQALPLLNDNPSMRSRVMAKAQEFIQTHTDQFGGDVPSRDKLEIFCERLEFNLQQQERNFSQTHKQLAQHHGEHGKPNLESALEAAAVTSMARQSERLFQGMSLQERILLQAMYAEPELNRQVAQQDCFKTFRMDKGERAIESYLFKERTAHDGSLVSLIVSEDIGAREAINSLRDSSRNTILVVSKSGLQTALHYLDSGMIPGPPSPTPRMDEPNTPLVDPRQRWQTHPNNARAAKIIHGRREHHPTALHLPTEGEWARRLAELIDYGRWTPPQVTASKGIA